MGTRRKEEKRKEEEGEEEGHPSQGSVQKEKGKGITLCEGDAKLFEHVLIAHVISMLARLRSHRLCRRRALSWMDRRLYGTEIQDWFSPPFGAVVVRRSECG